ncbi:hypothetical protein EYF80_015239 [Liparis tanakae]|uniref:Uncharacterized protein n=1 Tax=Liparis tanakae TaxID=230148 RepID=A0A4Z2I8R3_9TELE|nr:hypothetical protein EYF80_015239 [Liparis tanakae]
MCPSSLTVTVAASFPITPRQGGCHATTGDQRASFTSSLVSLSPKEIEVALLCRFHNFLAHRAKPTRTPMEAHTSRDSKMCLKHRRELSAV